MGKQGGCMQGEFNDVERLSLVALSPELKGKFVKGSKIAAALTTSKKKHQ